MDPAKNCKVIEEVEETRVPSEDEVMEYANFLEIDPEKEPHLMWIAREGVVAPVPHPWKMCTENDEDFFYFNFETGESVWDHPCDEKYRAMVEEHRAKGKNDKSGGDSLESGMTSKLDSKLDASIASAASPSLPLPGDTPVKDEHGNKIDGGTLDISDQRDGAKDDVCKFEQDSAMNSSIASVAGVNISKGSPIVEKGKLTEASDESSASSESISGPASPKSVASEASASRSGVAEAADKSKEPEDVKSPLAGGASSTNARSPGQAAVGQTPSPGKVSSIDATPQRGLLEASGADVVVDLAEESVASNSISSPLPSPSGAGAGKASSKSPSAAADAGAGASPKRGGDDAAGKASSQAVVEGWQNIVGKATSEAAKKEAEAEEAQKKEQEKKAGSESRSPELQRQAPAAAEEKPRGGVGLGGAEEAPSEVSEECPSDFAATSPSASQSGALGGRASPQSGTPEPPAAAVAAELFQEPAPKTVQAATDSPGKDVKSPKGLTAAEQVKQPPQAWSKVKVEAELESLARCLSMLRDVREKQSKFLHLLRG